MNSCYDIQLHSMLLLLSTWCKKLNQREGHVLSVAPQALCLKLLEENSFEIWYGGEVISIMKVTLFWDVITYGLVAMSQQFKRICCLLFQERSLFRPEDGDSMLFQNIGTFFQTTCGHISEHSNLNSPHQISQLEFWFTVVPFQKEALTENYRFCQKLFSLQRTGT